MHMCLIWHARYIRFALISLTFVSIFYAWVEIRYSIVILKGITRGFRVVHLATWWRHQMETFPALLTICAGNSPVTGEFPAQRPVMRSFDVFFDLSLNKRLSKQSRGLWFEMSSRLLWRHGNVINTSNVISWTNWARYIVHHICIFISYLYIFFSFLPALYHTILLSFPQFWFTYASVCLKWVMAAKIEQW